MDGFTKKDKRFGQSCKSKVVCLSKMHHISKNWQCIFDYQYKVTIGQCEETPQLIPLLRMYLANDHAMHACILRKSPLIQLR